MFSAEVGVGSRFFSKLLESGFQKCYSRSRVFKNAIVGSRVFKNAIVGVGFSKMV